MDDVTRAITDVWPDQKRFVVLTRKDWNKIRAVVRSSSGNDLPFEDMFLLPLVLED